MKRTGHKVIHEMIARTAKALAEAAYEELARENAFYAANPDVSIYVARAWKHYIPFARGALLATLQKDFHYEVAMGIYTPEGVDVMKNEVYEALLLDGSYKAPAEPARPEAERAEAKPHFVQLH